MEGEDRKGGEWFSKFTDANFFTYAPDDAPHEDMEAALAEFLAMPYESQKKMLHAVGEYVCRITALTPEQYATHRWMRLTVARLRTSTADWYDDFLLSDAEQGTGFWTLRTGVPPPPKPPRPNPEEEQRMEEEGAPGTEQVGAQMIETRNEEEEMELSPRAERELEEAALGSMEAEMEGEEESAGLDATQRMASVKLGDEETRGSRPRVRTASSAEEVAEMVKAAVKGTGASERRIRRRALAATSDEEAAELKDGGIETITQLMVTMVLRWRKLKENVPTCSNLTAQFASHRDAAAPAALAYGEEPTRARREAQVLFGAAGPKASKEFIFRKGVSTLDAPAGTAASDAALDWLARKARENPAQLINGKPYHFPPHARGFPKTPRQNL
jgi:hypothetical protein